MQDDPMDPFQDEKWKVADKDDSKNDIEITGSGTGQALKHKVKEMDDEEWQGTKSGEMLRDVAINVAQSSLNNQFPFMRASWRHSL